MNSLYLLAMTFEKLDAFAKLHKNVGYFIFKHNNYEMLFSILINN